MTNQVQAVEQLRQYTRNDFTALRAFVQRVPAATIARLYFSEDENGDAPTATGVERHLRAMQADLVDLAIQHGSPVLADHLKASTRKHGSARLSAISLKMVEEAARLAVAEPAADHAVGVWFRPMVALQLKAGGIATVGELIDFCNRRGGSWWRAIRRIGPGRARRIVSWLRRHEASIGRRVASDIDETEPFKASDSQIVEIGGHRQTVVPLERMALRASLSGVDGINRAPAFSYIHARNDLDAVRSYLYQYRDQPKTLRSYTKEIERFLMWTVCVRGKALSAVLVDDCEAYKDFLKAPLAFVGPRAPRSSSRWRPFASSEMSAETQKYAVRALRAAFAWLVDVRYLAGNPWQVVKDPVIIERESDLQLERALPALLWYRLRTFIDAQCLPPSATYWRIVRVALLLSGDSGLRREELTVCRRDGMAPTTFCEDGAPVWQLKVLGKRRRERIVPVSPAAVDALRAHWHDRGLDFDTESAGPLISPLIVPPTPLAIRKHDGPEAEPYSPDGVNKMVRWAMKRLIAGMPDLNEAEMKQLATTSPHAFRHTFGTQAAAEDVPIDVLQKILGHRSLQTTTIYVQAEKQRVMRETSRLYAKNRTGRTGPR
ncbi:site-specific integrase (plasmid) [Paraburkholderia sp. D15]|uniref:phage integrase family protein n=1 Tax=Paraburkholderia sp. D15 TaxID=2880218 RepID=UPI00247923C5|nr:phage integrase family protein [Paraburkholderia sp. D15]WGS55121.1 site-specific integrase [Paraburkholderia sp. D15]